ncbi:uncharacterized protein BDZ99DRAFT_515672 [Mytilinidion resinicola]|uniref:Uncharacterized protein n=1 Tax=Mytilinidion resinicola TaxID=574789 RepID=A0A6A6Z2F8_9PEZI|nr:uncharacterized protein BDZ99DRAFT_515672 [Mytilinidion resinicola]KAF2814909.1 hypothetical protein BDZ99DRAFT_515672 [Mytilinidion resinicola]
MTKNSGVVDQAKGVLETVVVVVSLVRMITDTFGSTSDLYRKLKKRKEKVKEDVDEWGEKHGIPFRRDSSEEDSHRGSRRSRSRRHRRDRDHDYDSDEESIDTSRSLIEREYERGYHHLGHKFAVGDVIAQNQLQAQVIMMQQTIITIFQESALMYGPTHNPISHHLARLLDTARAARAGSIEALAQQYQRMLTEAPILPAVPLPPTVQPLTTLAIRGRPRSDSRDSMVTTNTGPTSITTRSAPHGLYCLYSLDLQEHIDQPLADNYREGGDGRCPYCSTIVNTRPGRAWELVKEDDADIEVDRSFRVTNRFVVKSHREGSSFACVLCTREQPSDTVCESIPALIDHIWKEHSCAEYEREIDIVEVD